MMSFEIKTMMVLSTAHLTLFTCNTALSSYDGPVWNKGDYGWFVYVPEDIDARDLPEDLRQCMKFARRKRCRWIMFDRDGPITPELPDYDWDEHPRLYVRLSQFDPTDIVGEPITLIDEPVTGAPIAPPEDA